MSPEVALALIAVAFALIALFPESATAAPALDGAKLALPWALPFVGIILTIAAGPLLFAKAWHRHYGKFALAWSVALLVPLALVQGAAPALAAFVHAALAEYLSFILLLFALYVVAGGILVTGNLPPFLRSPSNRFQVVKPSSLSGSSR